MAWSAETGVRPCTPRVHAYVLHRGDEIEELDRFDDIRVRAELVAANEILILP